MLSTEIADCWSFKAATEVKSTGQEQSKVTRHKACRFSQEKAVFSNNTHRAAESLWLILNSKKLILTMFASFLTAFVEERIFIGPYSDIFVNLQFSVGLIYILLNTNYVKHLFMCSLAICISSSLKCLLKSFYPF